MRIFFFLVVSINDKQYPSSQSSTVDGRKGYRGSVGDRTVVQ